MICSRLPNTIRNANSDEANSPEHTENRPTRRMTAQGNNEKEPPKPLPHPAAPPRPPRPDGRQNLPGAHGSPGNCRKMRSVLFDADDQTQPGNYTQIRAAFKEKVEAADMAGLVEVMRLDC